MTIVSVRFYFKPENKRQELALSRSLWGFAEWFPRRLKPIREQLRGMEAKGVDIVNFMLFENPDRARRLNEWHKVINTFEHHSIYDLAPLVRRNRIESIRELMHYASGIALNSALAASCCSRDGDGCSSYQVRGRATSAVSSVAT